MAHYARGWNQRYTKLAPGPFTGKIIQASTAGMQLGLVAWGTSLLVTGAVPAGGRSFGLLAAPGHSARLSGRVLANGTVATRSDKDELYFISEPDARMVVLTIEHQTLDRALGMMFGADWHKIGGSAAVLRVRDPAALQASLRGKLAAMLRHPEHLANPALAAQIEEELFLTLFSRLDLPVEEVHPAERLRLARRADEYLREHSWRPVSIAELCAAIGARERTLHVACREHLGLPPGAYLRVLRLHGARRDLRELGQATTVTDTATRWGFFHFGEFAAAYRRLFGEPPSQTARAGAR